MTNFVAAISGKKVDARNPSADEFGADSIKWFRESTSSGAEEPEERRWQTKGSS